MYAAACAAIVVVALVLMYDNRSSYNQPVAQTNESVEIHKVESPSLLDKIKNISLLPARTITVVAKEQKDVTLPDGTTVDQFSSNYIQSSQKVGPSMADDIKNAAILAVIFAMICMAAYILLRFSDISFSIGAFASVATTTLCIISFYTLLWKILPFSMEVDQTFIAAILTIIGYSINDTVVVFDRIRETIALYPKRDRYQVINEALNSTLCRTLNTSLTTLVVVLCIFILGGATIRSFTFAILLGIIVGTYSTLFVATPIAYELQKKKINKKAAAETAEK